jgi:pimeloyl-ACP methyl ester carboxylesterase
MFGRSMMIWEPIQNGILFKIYTEIDTKQLGLGGPLQTDVTLYRCDQAGFPVSFERESKGKSLKISFETDEARAVLPDGGAQIIPTGKISAVFDSNLVGLTALYCALWWEKGELRGNSFSGSVFIPSQLLVVPYQLIPHQNGQSFNSSFDEIIELNNDGGLVSITMPKQAITVKRDEDVLLADILFRLKEDKPLNKPQRPLLPSLRSTEVDIPAGELTLRALVTHPDGTGPWPSVLFLPGSGSIDRFGLAGEIDTGLREIADAISIYELLTVTVDKPGSGDTQAGANALERTFENTVQEAAAVLDYLLSSPNVSTGQIAVVGHSLGGLVALRLAIMKPDHIRAVATLAAPGRTLDQVIEDQILWRGQQLKLPDNVVQAQVEDLHVFVNAIHHVDEWKPGTVPDRFLAAARSRQWMKHLITINPVELVSKLQCPLGIFQGERDVQISLQNDATRLVEAARQAAVPVEIHFYPDLDHLFKPTPPDAGIEPYFDSSRRVDIRMINDLAAFLTKHLSTSRHRLI